MDSAVRSGADHGPGIGRVNNGIHPHIHNIISDDFKGHRATSFSFISRYFFLAVNTAAGFPHLENRNDFCDSVQFKITRFVANAKKQFYPLCALTNLGKIGILKVAMYCFV
jgi:hypothetical protein